MKSRALDDIVVTEFSDRMAASVCGSLLAQLGATVIRVERGDGNVFSDVPGCDRAVAARGKCSLVQDPANRDGLVDALVRCSDIVLTSSDTGFDVADAECIVCDITAFGRSGPMQGQPYSEYEIQAYSGLAATTGFAHGSPTPLLLPIASYLTGTYAAGAVLAALRGRDVRGLNQNIEVALYDCSFVTLNTFLSSILTNPLAKTSRMGNWHPTVAPWNTYRAKDGWVLICAGNQAQWIRLCQSIGRPELAAQYESQADRIRHRSTVDAIIEAWTSEHDTDLVVDTLAKAQVACGPITKIDQYPREANIAYRKMVESVGVGNDGVYFAPASPLRMSRSPGKSLNRVSSPDQDRSLVESLVGTRKVNAGRKAAEITPVLSGLRVIEIGQYTTAPLCARHLAHLGAEVIKIERPGGDESREWPPHVDGRSASFRLNNADKKSLALDLNDIEDQETLRRLITTADVLVENLKPGALAKFGFTPESIQSIKPSIVYCSISGFGANSIYRKRPAFDTVIQAMSGIMSSVTDSNIPLKTGVSVADTMGAEIAIAAILGALRYSSKTGKGQYIDLSMQDIGSWMTEACWNGNALKAPLLLSCRDGYVVVDDEAASTDSFDTQTSEMLVDDVIQQYATASRRAVRVRNVRDASEDEQTKARNLWFYKREGNADWPMLTSPLRLIATPPTASRLAPDPDEHGDEVRASLARDW